MSFSIVSVGGQSPWGTIQHVSVIADGIVAVSTAGHGGLRLIGKRLELFRELVPEFEPWTGRRNLGWFEEDCDWCAVAILWPSLFPAHVVEGAWAVAWAMAKDNEGGPYRRGWKAVVAKAQALKEADEILQDDLEAAARLYDQVRGRIMTVGEFKETVGGNLDVEG